MKRASVVLVVSVFVALLLGWTIGSFFTGRSVGKVIASIPASPIVVNAAYNKEHHSIIYSVMNPGGTPITIVDESFVFTPGKETKEKGYIVSHVPVHINLPPGTITAVELKLKEGTEKLKVGDAVLATFTYVHPLSPDIYTVAHPFKFGVKAAKEQEKQKGGK